MIFLLEDTALSFSW